MLCRECKHFKNFNYTYGCDKFKKVIIDPESSKDCFEGYDNNNYMNFFNDILGGKKSGY